MVATWWRQKSPGGAYWRCTVPARRLPGRVNKLTYTDITEDETGFHFPHQVGDCAIWPFSANAARGTVMAEMQSQGLRVLLEVDDNYLVPAPGMNADWQVDFARGGDTDDGDLHSIAAHRRITEWVDGVICSTERVASIYSRINPNVWVCPNSIEPLDWAHPPGREDDILRIGWAASHSHFVDRHLVKDAMEWAVKQPNVEVFLIGYQPNWRGPFRRIEWTDTLDDYRRQLVDLRLDVGICPLKPSEWADCKSDVKALEYAVAGAMPVMSPVEAYRPWFGRDDCVFAKKPVDWHRVLRWCVAHRDDVRAAAQRARKHVLTERTIDKSISAWREAICG